MFYDQIYDRLSVKMVTQNILQMQCIYLNNENVHALN